MREFYNDTFNSTTSRQKQFNKEIAAKANGTTKHNLSKFKRY